MRYEVFTKQCKWVGESEGGFTATIDGRRFEQHLLEFCAAQDVTPIGGVSVIVLGGDILVSQACYKPGAAKKKK